MTALTGEQYYLIDSAQLETLTFIKTRLHSEERMHGDEMRDLGHALEAIVRVCRDLEFPQDEIARLAGEVKRLQNLLRLHDDCVEYWKGEAARLVLELADALAAVDAPEGYLVVARDRWNARTKLVAEVARAKRDADAQAEKARAYATERDTLARERDTILRRLNLPDSTNDGGAADLVEAVESLLSIQRALVEAAAAANK